ncbi:MAG: hypothetical protein GX589_01235 [Deltaproteobacteria bacterium]|nr:hypothetical protein [Deltaproteobacteria bacterium]
MLDQLRALMVDQNSGADRNLAEALLPEISLTETNLTNTTHNALQAILEGEFHLCFVSDKVPPKEAEMFIRDVSSLKRKQECIFIQVRDQLPADFDRTSLKDMGFQCIISKTCSHDDKTILKNALQEYFHSCEIKRRVQNVDHAMKMALGEIDRAAENVRRGRKPDGHKLSLNFVTNQTEFDHCVLDEYYTTLEKKVEDSKPADAAELEIPSEVLRRALPCLSSKFYSGASHRVWKKLTKRYGKKV